MKTQWQVSRPRCFKKLRFDAQAERLTGGNGRNTIEAIHFCADGGPHRLTMYFATLD